MTEQIKPTIWYELLKSAPVPVTKRVRVLGHPDLLIPAKAGGVDRPCEPATGKPGNAPEAIGKGG